MQRALVWPLPSFCEKSAGSLKIRNDGGIKDDGSVLFMFNNNAVFLSTLNGFSGEHISLCLSLSRLLMAISAYFHYLAVIHQADKSRNTELCLNKSRLVPFANIFLSPCAAPSICFSLSATN